MTASASLIERHPGVIDLAIRNQSGIRSFRIGSAVSLDAAYAGSTTIITVPVGSTFRSRTLQRNRKNMVDESSRGLTRVAYDPVDFASATVPGDSDISFVRVSAIDLAGTVQPEGPILVVPPPGYFVAGRALLNLNGTAPLVAGLANNLPPQDAMRVDLPKYTDRVEITNSGANSIFVSFGLGTQEFLVPTLLSRTFHDVGATEIFLRASVGTSAFRMVVSLVNGIQA